MLLQDTLDAHGKRQGAHGTTGTGALQLQFDDALVVNAHILHIAAVSLQVGANLFKNLLKQLFVNSHRGSFLTITRARPRTEAMLLQPCTRSRAVHARRRDFHE